MLERDRHELVSASFVFDESSEARSMVTEPRGEANGFHRLVEVICF